MKVSLITIVFNGEAFLKDCIESVIAQDYADIEYIVIDGASKDNTVSIINQYNSYIRKFISEPDKGLYDAINKGIDLASGEVIGLLNADDMLAGNDVITKIVALFRNDASLEAVYGDLNYVNPRTLKIIRKWKSKQAERKDLLNGWMPPHPTLYVRKDIFKKFGNYALDLGTAADYDLMLRLLYTHTIRAKYLPILMINMRMGGLSNGSLKGILMAAKNDFTALKRNNLPSPLLVLLKKKFAKISQFL